LIRVGTRGSALALTQARWVAERIEGETELVTINATGPIDDKSRWVSELERALVEDRIDVAVHSAKDVPTELPDGLELVAFPPREDPRDAICGSPSLAALRSGARVGTSSLRRSAQVRALRPDLEVLPVRGNVDTRLRKLREGECDALVLAAAGLHRLGLQPDGLLEDLVPAAGQGALAIEARLGTALPELVDVDATRAVTAERELVHALGASCNTPVGAHARAADGGHLELSAWVGLPDGTEWLSDRLCGGPDEIGRLVAGRLRATGAAELLRRAERELAR
jgi:hydroxymethylbilane synthase